MGTMCSTIVKTSGELLGLTNETIADSGGTPYVKQLKWLRKVADSGLAYCIFCHKLVSIQ